MRAGLRGRLMVRCVGRFCGDAAGAISRRSKVGGGYDVVDDEEAGDVLYLIVASGKSIRNRSAGFRERLGDGERHHFLLCQVIHCFLTTWV